MKRFFHISIALLLFSFVLIPLNAQRRIKMEKEGSMYYIPCEVNGLKLRFLFDTGASDVCLSLTEAQFMLKNGYLDEDDLGRKSKAEIADGTLVDLTKINLREIKIGTLKLTNVSASIVHTQKASLLLGQSAIQQLGRYYFEDDYLVIMPKRKTAAKSDTPTKAVNKIALTPASSVRKNDTSTNNIESENTSFAQRLKKAEEIYLSGKNEEAIRLIKALKSENEEKFGLKGLYLYMMASYFSSDNSTAIILAENFKINFEKIKSPTVSEIKYYSLALRVLGSATYVETENVSKSILLLKGAAVFNSENELEDSNTAVYSFMASIYYLEKDYENAVKHQLYAFNNHINIHYEGEMDVFFKKADSIGFKDKDLGEISLNLSQYYNLVSNEKKSNTILWIARLCGNEEAIEMYGKQK